MLLLLLLLLVLMALLPMLKELAFQRLLTDGVGNVDRADGVDCVG